MTSSLFNDLDVTSARITTVTPAQQDLLIVINRLSGDRGEWTGPRSVLAAELGCSVDTVTRRKDVLVAAGLLEVNQFGRSLRYRLIQSAVASLPRVAGCDAPSPAVPGQKARRPWWRLPDVNQLDLFASIETRQDARAALKAATLHWIGLIVLSIFGPAAKPAAQSAAPATSTARARRRSMESQAATTAEPDAPAANASVVTEKPDASAANDNAVDLPIKPIPIPTEPIPPKAQLQRPIEPIKDKEDRSLQNCLGKDPKKFCIWKDAKESDFRNPQKIRELFRMLVDFGICTEDEELLVFRAVANKTRLKKDGDDIPGLITAIFRGAGKTPWRALGSAADMRLATEQIKSLDYPLEMRKRTSNLDSDRSRDEKLKAARAWAKEHGL